MHRTENHGSNFVCFRDFLCFAPIERESGISMKSGVLTGD